MSDTASLVIKVTSDSVAQANERLEKLHNTAGKTEKATDLLKGAFTKIIGPLLAVTSAVEAIHKIFEVTQEFEVLEGKVARATGSLVTAHAAFVALREIAEKSPFSIREVTENFTKLVNLGLNPSEKALKSYINTATALNVSLDTVTDAVARAALGQFRGLIELGIRATEVEDGIVLNFKGTTTKIKKDSAELQEYIINLGNTTFGKLPGAPKKLVEDVRDLKYAWENFFAAISEQTGAKNIFAFFFRTATEALHELTDEIASGQLLGYIKAISSQFQGLADDIYETYKLINQIISASTKGWQNETDSAIKFIIEAFRHLPANVLATVRALGATAGAMFQYYEAATEGIKKLFLQAFMFIVDSAKIAGQYVADSLNPLKKSDLEASIKQWVAMSTKAAYDVSGTVDTFKNRIISTAGAYGDTVTAILNQRDVAVKSFEDQITAADKLRAVYEANRKAREEANKEKDPLAGFSTKKGSTHITTPEELQQFEALKKELQLEEDSIAQSYRRRRALIINNTQEGDAVRLELLKRLEDDVTIEYDKAAHNRFDHVKQIDEELNAAIAEGRMADVDALNFALQTEETQIADSYARRRQIILDDTKLTVEQKLAAQQKLETQYTQRQREMELRRNTQTLATSSALFASLADIAEQSAGKQTGIYKVLFAASKAFAIAESLVKIQQGIASAAATPFPANIAAMAAVAAATAGIISNITSVALAFEHGGMIGAGKYGITQEAGFEVVQGPAVVTSARNTADRGYGKGGGENNVQVIVNNHTDAQAQVVERDTADGKVIEVLIKRLEGNLVGGIRTGGSPFTRALEGAYQLKRGAA